MKKFTMSLIGAALVALFVSGCTPPAAAGLSATGPRHVPTSAEFMRGVTVQPVAMRQEVQASPVERDRALWKTSSASEFAKNQGSFKEAPVSQLGLWRESDASYMVSVEATEVQSVELYLQVTYLQRGHVAATYYGRFAPNNSKGYEGAVLCPLATNVQYDSVRVKAALKGEGVEKFLTKSYSLSEAQKDN